MELKKLNTRYKIIVLSTAVILSAGSCKKFIEVDAPNTSINTKNVYNSNATAAAVLTGLYVYYNESGPLISIQSGRLQGLEK